MNALHFFLCLLFCQLTTTSQASSANSSTIRTVYQFSTDAGPVALENIAVRPNGNLLITTSTAAHVYTIDLSNHSASPELITQFPNANGTFGITELRPDVFAVVSGNYSPAYEGVKGSFSVWQVNFKQEPPAVDVISHLQEAEALNGITTGPSNTVLIADSDKGCIWSLNVTSASYEEFATSSAFRGQPFGINGIHMYGKLVYYTNTAKRALGRFLWSGKDIEVISRPAAGQEYDDLAMSSEGDTFIAVHPHSIIKVRQDGSTQNLTQNGDRVVQPTSIALGIGQNACKLYVVTAGNLPEGGSTNGQILEMDVCESK